MIAAGSVSFRAAVVAMAACLVITDPAAAEVVAITNAEIHTLGSSGTLASGTVLMEDGVIRAVGDDVAIPAGARVIDATGKVVTPGIVDAHGYLGLTEISQVASSEDRQQNGARFTASFDVADAINPRSSLIAVNRIEGVTRAIVSPTLGGEGSAISGLGAIIHLGGPKDYLVRRGAALFVHLDEAGAAISGGSRVLATMALREALQDARDYAANREAYEAGNRRKYARARLDLEALERALSGEIPVVITVHRASDIEAALTLGAEFGLRLIIAGGAESWMVADDLARAGVPVILDPLKNLPSSFQSLGARLDAAAILYRAGVTVVFADGDSHNARNVTQAAGNAVAAGLPWHAALRAITSNPAAIYGMAGQVGSLETGKDADVVVWSGDPLEVTTFAVRVFIRGEDIPMVSRHTLMRDRYLDLDRDLPPPIGAPDDIGLPGRAHLHQGGNMTHFRAIHRTVGYVCCAMVLAACGGEPGETADSARRVAAPAAAAASVSYRPVTATRIIQANAEAGNWLAHGRTYDEQRYSPLNWINTGNVDQLGLAWHYDLDTRRGLEATPLVAGGVMYTSGSWSIVYALNAATGELIWKYDPEVPGAWAKHACCDVVNRGVALWESRVYVGTLDGRLVALNARTGEVVWETLTVDPDRPYTITGAPRVVKGKVIIGNGGADYGVRGYVSAYDARSGDLAWRFYTVPGNPEEPFENAAMKKAAATWSGGKWWEIGGGGTVWDSMAYDAEMDLLYIGVGNGSPWNKHIRSPGGGDNLFLSSIVALDPDTGEYVWHYQTTPGDSWDYTATQHMILADLRIDGVLRKVIMQAPKNGFFYVLDRKTGEFISAEPFVPVTWAKRVDPKTGRPEQSPGANYESEPRLVQPSAYGGHNWQPMSYSPMTGLVYIPAIQIPFIYGQKRDFEYAPGYWNTGVDPLLLSMPEDPAGEQAVMAIIRGHLSAWDPVNQEEVWRVDHWGPWNGGMLTTAGNLLFQGTGDGRFVAYSADEGAKLWSADAGTGIIAAPVTYTVGNDQYVAIMAGWGGIFALSGGKPAAKAGVRNVSRVLVYRLGGDDSLPAAPDQGAAPPAPPPMTADNATVQFGKTLYHDRCSACHGDGAVAGGVLPDLRHMDAATLTDWHAIVLAGTHADLGMASFGDVLGADESGAILAYVIKRAHDERNAQGAP